MPHDCAQRGHHFHEADGVIFSRKRDRAKRDEIALHCCHCQTTATQTGWGERLAATPNMVACGESVTMEEQ